MNLRDHRHRFPTPQAAAASVSEWNAKHPVGTRVNVRMDDGTFRLTTTRSEAWVIGGHTAVVNLMDFSGGYRLDRCVPIWGQIDRKPKEAA